MCSTVPALLWNFFPKNKSALTLLHDVPANLVMDFEKHVMNDLAKCDLQDRQGGITRTRDMDL